LRILNDNLYLLTGYYIEPILSFSLEATLLRNIIKSSISFIIINIGYGFGIAYGILEKDHHLTMALILLNSLNSFLLILSISGDLEILIAHI